MSKNKLEQYIDTVENKLEAEKNSIEWKLAEIKRKKSHFDFLMGDSFSGFSDESELKLINSRMSNFKIESYHDIKNIYDKLSINYLDEKPNFKAYFQRMTTYDPSLIADDVFCKLRDYWNKFSNEVEHQTNILEKQLSKEKEWELKKYIQDGMIDIYNRKMYKTVYESIQNNENPLLKLVDELALNIKKEKNADPFYLADKIYYSDESSIQQRKKHIEEINKNPSLNYLYSRQVL